MTNRTSGRKREREGGRISRIALSFFVSSLPIWGIILQSQTITVDEYMLSNYENVRLYKSANISTLLAYQQSFGFFDDIPDVAWKRMQTRARTSPRYRNATHPEDRYRNPGWWYAHNLQPVFNCFNMERVGGLDDGPKWTCDPYRLLERPSCLIYSIGSAGQYQWEQGLVQRLGSHCEIHVFE